MLIDIAGEDQVTQAIIERVIADYRPDLIINNKFPVRGGQIQNLAPKLNLLQTPTFILTDLDSYNCAPELLHEWLHGQDVNKHLLFRIAIDEAESWLMADRIGFASWLGISAELIPSPIMIDAQTGAMEMRFPYKPSLFMMMELAVKSNNLELREFLTPVSGAKKGPAYNAALIPFIKNVWNIQRAAINSDSLKRAINRLNRFRSS